MLAGDFNDIASVEEKKGGESTSLHKYTSFKKRINVCKLIDIGTMGPKFT